MKPAAQPDLFAAVSDHTRPSRVPGAAQREPARGHWEPFDFMDATANDPRMVSQPGAVIPEEIRLVTDDPDWVPKGRFG